MANPKKSLSPEEVKELFSLTSRDITAKRMREYFAATETAEARFNTFDTILLPVGKLFNRESMQTTIGRYIFNMFCLPERFLRKYGYQNIVIDKKGIGDLETKIGQMLFNDELTTQEVADYLDRTEWLSFNMAYYMVPSLNYDITVPFDDVIKERDALFEKYKKELDAGDINAADLIEKQLLDLAKKDLEASGNEAYDFYKSKFFNFENNYKKSSIFSGIVENPFTKKIDVLKSNYADGILPEDVAKLNNLTVVGGYSRGVATEQGGYFTKKVNNATQSIVIDEPGTDCGTPHYMKVIIRPEIKSMFLLRYILDSSKLVLLTDENIDKYVGKPVLMRSPMFCKGDKICNKCAGETFYRMGVRNVGLFVSEFAGSLLNLMIRDLYYKSLMSHLIQ